jgi:hypothetical protein
MLRAGARKAPEIPMLATLSLRDDDLPEVSR